MLTQNEAGSDPEIRPAKPSLRSRASANLHKPIRLASQLGRRSSTLDKDIRSDSEEAPTIDSTRFQIRLRPLDSERPLATLRVRVVRADGLVVRDRNGTSDPFISLRLPPLPVSQTPVIKKTLEPSWDTDLLRDKSTFDWPIYASLAQGLYSGRGVELVVWDRDFAGVRKEYMGEVGVRLDQWADGGLAWHEKMPAISYPLHSSRCRQRRRKRKNQNGPIHVSGQVYLQIGLVPLPGETITGLSEEWAKEIHSRLQGNSSVPSPKQSHTHHATLSKQDTALMTVPAYEGIGTVRLKPAKKARARGPKSALQAVLPSGIFSRKTKQTETSTFSGVVSDTETEGEEDGSDSEEDALQDNGLTSSSSDDEMDDGDVYSMGFLVPFKERRDTDTSVTSSSADINERSRMLESTIHEESVLSTSPEREIAPRIKTDQFETPAIVETAPVGSAGYFDRISKPHKKRSNKDLHNLSSSLMTPGTPSGMLTPSSVGGSKIRKSRFRKVGRKDTGGTEYNFGVGKDILGIVMLEITGAKDLPKLKNSLKFSFDMDPFVVISFGKKVFRTRVIRHDLNPVWDEKLLFHVRKHEDSFNIQFSLLDWDKVSGNDYIGSCTIPVQDLIQAGPRSDDSTGLYASGVDGKHEMKDFSIALATPKDAGWESRHSPVLNVRAKYEPYDALRQRFWRQYLLQFDTDNTNAISFTELTTMLDSLNSTLTTSTLRSYYTRFDKDPDADELSYEQIIQCLEYEIKKARSEKRHVKSEPPSGPQSPGEQYSMAPQPDNIGLGETGPSRGVDPDELSRHIVASRPFAQENEESESNGESNMEPIKVESSGPSTASQHLVPNKLLPAANSSTPDGSDSEYETNVDSNPTERVINIKSCPLCHRPRLNKKSEADIVTHLAVCASADWDRVDRIVVGNYVTASQAQRKFLSKVLTKVSAGAYSLGANSANIIVQDRMTGQLQEEKMAVYVRLGIRVLYKGAKKGMEGARAQRLLKSMSVKQGLKFNAPDSRLEIPSFIAFHKLNTDEILEPLDSFKTFNEFFYRKLKPDARPITQPDNPSTLVSCADCRMMSFETVGEATRIWIKGKEFSVGRLLGENYKDIWHKYDGGGLGIFRLAPQDYHRFHSPVDGIVGRPTRIDGQYYTVNPQAIRTTLDVYGENVREIWPIHSPQFGTVMTVWVGAMMVGSIGSSVQEGQFIKRGDELGWFAFGGSTIVCLFERGALQWDEDILQNSTQCIETLVRMGMGIGKTGSGYTGPTSQT